MKIKADILFFNGESKTQTKLSKLLKVKKELLEMKKEGTIFIDKPISMIEKDTEIDFYHISHPGAEETLNAFPIPKAIYSKKKDSLGPLLKEYFSAYYKGSYLKDSEITQYNTKPFEAKETVWFYKK